MYIYLTCVMCSYLISVVLFVVPSSVEWCHGSDQFSPIVGEFVLTDLRTSDYIIPDLNKVVRKLEHEWGKPLFVTTDTLP